MHRLSWPTDREHLAFKLREKELVAQSALPSLGTQSCDVEILLANQTLSVILNGVDTALP